MITERQEKILNSLIREYIDVAEPISSSLLQKKSGLDVSPATIRNDLQELTEKGYITQPHTSAGRVPTEKGYRFFVEITFSGRLDEFPDFILREAQEAKENIEKELQMARHLAKSLEEISSMLDFNHVEEHMLFDVLKIMGPSKVNYKKHTDIMKQLLDEFENF